MGEKASSDFLEDFLATVGKGKGRENRQCVGECKGAKRCRTNYQLLPMV